MDTVGYGLRTDGRGMGPILWVGLQKKIKNSIEKN
jgi:hypothetical protein